MQPHLFAILMLLAQPAPDPIDSARHLAATHRESGNIEAALTTLTQALCTARTAAAPAGYSSVRLARAWADAWDVAGRPKAPQTQLDLCLQGHPLGAIAQAAAADTSGLWKEAESLCAKALADKTYQAPIPEALRGELWRRQAAAASHQGLEQRALTLLQRGLADAPGAAELYLATARAQLALGAPHAAHSVLLPLLELPENVDPALLRQARMLIDSARDLAAPPLTPQETAENKELIALMQTASEDDDDVAHVRDVAATTPQPRLWPPCALVLLKGPDPGLGRALLVKAEKALPLDPDPSRLLAVYYLSGTDFNGALPPLLRAVQRQPFDPEAQVMLASVATRTAQWHVAEKAYSALIRLEPDKTTHKESLAAMREQQKLHDSKPLGQ